MSCGSTICKSIAYEAPAPKLFAGFEWFRQRLVAFAVEIDRHYERWHQRRQLLELDDRLLVDIGLSREDAVEEACKSTWIRVTMWRIYQ